MPWPRGKPKSSEQREKIRRTLIIKRGRLVTCSYCGQSFRPWWSKSKYCSRLCSNRATAPPKGVISLHLFTAEAKEKSRQAHIGIRYSEEVNKRKGRSRPGSKHSEATRKLLSQLAQTEQRLRLLRERNRDADFQSRRLAACRKKPNQAEARLAILLADAFPGEWKFVGAGEVILGGLNPDFINTNGKKAVIELFGDYWHSLPGRYRTEPERAERFCEYGYELLVIWERELQSPTAALAKVRNRFYAPKDECSPH